MENQEVPTLILTFLLFKTVGLLYGRVGAGAAGAAGAATLVSNPQHWM
jgi:hypothetical protein